MAQGPRQGTKRMNDSQLNVNQPWVSGNDMPATIPKMNSKNKRHIQIVGGWNAAASNYDSQSCNCIYHSCGGALAKLVQEKGVTQRHCCVGIVHLNRSHLPEIGLPLPPSQTALMDKASVTTPTFEGLRNTVGYHVDVMHIGNLHSWLDILLLGWFLSLIAHQVYGS